MRVEVRPARRHEHKNRVKIRIDGHDKLGWLVPDLLSTDKMCRNLILLDMVPAEVPIPFKERFEKFVEDVESLDGRNLSAAKKAVVKIAAGDWKERATKVVVHKMGPVPAFVLPGVQVEIPHRKMSAGIAIFPLRARRQLSLLEHPKDDTSSNLFDSLTALDLRPVLYTYLEDTFEHLYDMIDNLGLFSSTLRIKAVRELLGQSIGSKLHVLVPSKESWSRYCERSIAKGSFEEKVCRWFNDNYTIAFEALYFSCVADKLIQYFYDILGIEICQRQIEIRNQSYEFDNCKRQFQSTYNLPDDALQLSQSMNETEALMRYFTSFDNESLRTFSVDTDFGYKVRDFLDFLATVRREQGRIYEGIEDPPRDSIVFVSRRLASPFGTAAITAIKSVANEVSGGLSRVTTFIGDGGEPLRRSIKAQLWLSDAVWSLLPERDHDTGSNLKWVYLEAEHAWITNKKSLVIARSTEDIAHSISLMELVEDDMLAQNTMESRDSIKSSVLNGMKDKISIVVGEGSSIQDKIRQPLEEIREELPRIRRRIMLAGFLNVFEQNDRDIFDLAFRHFQDRRFKKADLRKHCVEMDGMRETQFDKAFTNAHDRSKKLRFKIKREFRQVLQRIDNTQYYRIGLIRMATEITDGVCSSRNIIIEDVVEAFQMAK